jgi:hypothetical protein
LSDLDKGLRSITEYPDAANILFTALETEQNDITDTKEGRHTKISTLVTALAAFHQQYLGPDFDIKAKRWHLTRKVKEEFPDLRKSVSDIANTFKFGKKLSILRQVRC